MTVLFSDSGSGADANPIGGSYVTLTGISGLRRVSNQIANASGSDGDHGAYINVTTDNDHYCKFTCAAVGGRDGGPMVRVQTGSFSGHFITDYNATDVEAYLFVSGSPSLKDRDAGTYNTGNEIYLEAQGNNFVSKIAGSTINSYSDTTYSSGKGGLFFYDSAIRGTNVEVGNFATGQSINAGLNTETDSAFSVGKKKSKAVGLCTETDSVLAMTMGRQFSVGLATESDSALALANKRKSKAVGLSIATDTAFAVAATGGAQPESSYFTDFPDTENPLDQDGMFRVGTETDFYGTPRSTPGKCFAATFVGEIAADYDDCLAHLINHAIPVNHRITATVFRATAYNPSDTHELALYAHMVIGAEFVRGYEFLFSAGGSFQIVIWLGTDHDLDNFDTSLSLTGPGPGTLANGDEIAVQVEVDGGTVNFELFKNGDSVGTCSDDTWTNGNPGMGFFVRPGDTTKENFCLTSWAVTAAGTFEAVGLGTETDSAFALAKRKSKSVGLPASADSALALAHAKRFNLGLTSETDSALALRPTRYISVGLASQTSSALAITRSKRMSLAMAAESDSALHVVGPSGGNNDILRNLPLNWWTK